MLNQTMAEGRRLFFVLIALGATAAPLSALAVDEAKQSDAELQKRRVQRLVLDFTKSRRNAAKRLELIGKARELGDPAAARLMAVLEKELEPQIRSYRDRFTKAALALEKNRSKAINSEEVGRLRGTVLELRNNPNLTKEMIVETADPAMKRLTQLLLPELATVAQSSAALGKQRAALVAAGQMWEMCGAAVAEQAAKSGTGAEPPSFENYLRGEEQVALQIATTLDAQARKALSVNAQLSPKLEAEEASCVAACNLTRGLLGLPLLEIDPLLCQTARDHSHDMETKEFFSHESPVEGKKTPWDRAKRFGTSSSGENIAVGISQGSAANLMWFHSPGHHRNMLGEHARIGVGRSGSLWTEMFGG